MVNSSSQVAKIGFPHSSIVDIGFPSFNNTFRLPHSIIKIRDSPLPSLPLPPLYNRQEPLGGLP